MIKCESYPNHHLCKHLNTCEFWISINSKYKKLLQEINCELRYLKELNHRKVEYFRIFTEINDLVYTETFCIKGKLENVPKINALGKYIMEPEDVIVDLNYNVITQEIKDTESIIRELRKQEQNILRILKKRADKYD